MKAPVHPRQEERLKALGAYDILDSESEKDFDDIVKLAAEICGTKMSIISLVEADRQWFKAETGLGTRETPIEQSICSHAILQDDVFEIRDTHADERTASNPLVTGDPRLRFYAGVPLNSSEGLPLGTLCVLDDKVHHLTPFQINALRVLGRQVMVQLELRRSLKHAETLRREADHRVKNSLQSVGALARIQKRRVKSDEAREALEAVTGRLAAISTLHELMHHTKDGESLDLGRYVRSLSSHLNSLAPDGVTLDVEATSVLGSSDHASALGSLVNELVSNAFKHAFPEGRSGTVRVDMHKDGDAVRLQVSDNGIGMPPESPKSGLGTMVVEASVQQLGGTFVDPVAAEGHAVAVKFTPDG